MIKYLKQFQVCFLLIILILSNFTLSFVSAAPAKTVYSIVSVANWTNGNHWSYTSGGAACSCVPDINIDNIYIETNTTSSSGLIFGASVTVVVRNNSILTINGDVEFKNGAVVIVETGSQIVINGNLQNKNNSTDITINGTLAVNGDFSAETGSGISGTGNMSTTGKATTAGTATVFGFPNDCDPGPCFTNSSTPLPVELLYYTAESDNTKVSLKWSTASELNNDRFIIERSENSIDFITVGQVKGAGNSNSIKEYSCIDKNNKKGTFYYRLKQIDFDGVYKYLDIKAVSNSGVSSDCDLFIKPNPCIGRCEISFENCNDEETQNANIMLFDAMGNAVYSSVSKQVEGGNASFEFENSNYLKPAVYIVRGSAGSKVKAKQILINK